MVGKTSKAGGDLGLSQVSGRPGETFTGGPDALPDLMRQAAETVMRQTQPLRYADFLSATGRFDEARAVLVPMTAQGSAEDRASAFASLGQVFQRSGDIVTGETIGRHAVRLNPDDVNTQMFLAFSAYSLSHSQLDFDALTAAQRALKDGTRRAPSLPFAFSEWGEAKLARGDIAGAIVLFRQAQAIGPRWADPVKYEADALVRQGDDRAALRGYAAAAKLAPRWGALHIAWGEALARSGRQEQAQLKWREASAMALSPGDQARLTSLLMRH